MVFPTLEFVLFFLFVFSLNSVLFSHPSGRKMLLLVASFLFYAAWDYRFLTLMMGVISLAWFGGIVRGRYAFYARTACIICVLTCLAVFKYLNFFIISLDALLGFHGDLAKNVVVNFILPMGISFYSFQAISYIVDCARGDCEPSKNPADVALYVSFFPQLVAGPIVRASSFIPQIDRPKPLGSRSRARAVLLILLGMSKKLVIANYIGVLLVDPVWAYPEGQDIMSTMAAMIGYAIQLFCDFSGYSDIAIGIALLLGYRFSINFNQPYRSCSFREMWRRWHISLSTFIRDYLYIPLGGKGGSYVRQSAVLIFVMTLAGFWHGAGLNFLIWGACHGCLLALERVSPKLRQAQKNHPFLSCLVTFLVFSALLIPFRAPAVGDSGAFFSAFGVMYSPDAVRPVFSVYILIMIGLMLNFLPLKVGRYCVARFSLCRPAVHAAALAGGLFFLFALSQDGTAPFIYFQF